MRRRTRVADLVISTLVDQGVSHLFGVGGANIEDLYDAAAAHGEMTAVVAKHEFSAATMADGYGRGTARLGVVAATSGGGALNLVAGLGESFASKVPVLALVGQPATTLDGRGSFQDTSGNNGALDGEALFSTVAVYCRRVVTPDDILEALPRAIVAARGGGPAVLLAVACRIWANNPPFGTSFLGVAAVAASFGAQEELEQRIAAITTERAYLRTQLSRLGLATTDSHANFVFLADQGQSWPEVFGAAGVQVRAIADHGVRITVGDRSSTSAVLAAVETAAVAAS